MDVRIQIDSKSGLFKNESKSEIFSASSDAQESANWTTINASQARLLIGSRLHQGAYQDLYKDAQKAT